MTERRFAPGFRLSKLDVLILVIGGATALALAPVHRWIGLWIVFVVAHFFLFCNVLRIARRLELVWAAALLALAASATGYGLLSWPLVFGLSAVVTLIVALIGIRDPSYHGVGWRMLNPLLPEWWSAHAGDGSEAQGDRRSPGNGDHPVPAPRPGND